MLDFALPVMCEYKHELEFKADKGNNSFHTKRSVLQWNKLTSMDRNKGRRLGSMATYLVAVADEKYNSVSSARHAI